ncbi:hypothetical protein HDV00_010757 [Rhizophlyctis rosea]|nr:hypothetical protein HDV00_010757 [Rhizophlyctis rosea]
MPNYRWTSANDDMDDLVERLQKQAKLDDPAEVFEVNRSRSRKHTSNGLSFKPGGRFTVIVHDEDRAVLDSYPNVHFPKPYVAKVKAEHPGKEVVYLLTSRYLAKKEEHSKP